ncbi:homoserine dehydrogenase [Halobacterium sp. MBLA0001]|uniref:homoserine dehydrogenase n=1 Tax=Halobacterium sp. MBLA0001 TaxID=3413511 RepID=UPI003C7505EB
MRLAVMGAGAVGQAVVDQAASHGHTVVAVADSTSAVVDVSGVDAAAVCARKRDAASEIGTGAPSDALAADYDVLVEATPTTLGDAEPGFGHVERALSADRHVVLANKGPVAERYAGVCELAAASAGNLRFEATVGGAIPVLATIERIGADRVRAVRGVLNGTANFVLSRMAAAGLGYEHVLAEAQEVGVAEADPTFDVDGTDAALKCAILANVIGDREYDLDSVSVDGITRVAPSALELAETDGQTIRLIGEVGPDHVRVGPRLVPANGTLAVSGTTNIVQLETEHAGRLNLSGQGAGGAATASAVLADVDHIADQQ